MILKDQIYSASRSWKAGGIRWAEPAWMAQPGPGPVPGADGHSRAIVVPPPLHFSSKLSDIQLHVISINKDQKILFPRNNIS